MKKNFFLKIFNKCIGSLRKKKRLTFNITEMIKLLKEIKNEKKMHMQKVHITNAISFIGKMNDEKVDKIKI